MKKLLKRTTIIILLSAVISYLYFDPYNQLYAQHWKCSYNVKNKELPWIDFIWAGSDIGNKHIEKAAILVPVKVEGISANLFCQLDLGSSYTMLYENPARALIANSETMKSKLRKSFRHKYLDKLHLEMGPVMLEGDHVRLMKNYGAVIPKDSLLNHPNDSVGIGTIGADIFRNKVLIIDYPNNRFCVLDSLPTTYQSIHSDMSIGMFGWIHIKMRHKGKNYDLFYDSGSSIFPLWVSKSMVSDFSPYPVDDTIRANRWGDILTVYSRPMKDTIYVGDHAFSDFRLYNNKLFESRALTYMTRKILGFDGLTGNALFFNNTVVLDFKNNKFGVF